MSYINEKFYKNAYMLEFLQKGKVEDVFTFSTAPQTEEFSMPQRVNETKTFGGAVIDDYGNDTIKITLSGTTGNNDKKIIYCGKKGKKHKTGEEELCMLRDLLYKYGEYNNLEKKKVYLYRLNNSTSVIATKEGDGFWWQVFCTDFTFKRDHSNPLVYNYTISFIGVKERYLSLFDVLMAMLTLMGGAMNVLSAITKAMEFLENVMSMYQMVMDHIEMGKGLVNKVTGRFEDIMDRINGFIDGFTDIFKETKSFGETILSSEKRILSTFADSKEIIENLGNTINDLADFIRKEFTPEQKSFPSQLMEAAGNSVTTLVDTFISIAEDMKDDYNEVKSVYKKISDVYSVAVIPGGKNEDDKLVPTYGYKKVTVSDGETWDSLAQQHFGSSSYASLLATYNANSVGVKDIKAGQEIFIPQLNDKESNVSKNNVYNKSGVKDNMGQDILMDASGDIAITSSDIKQSEGVNTLNQSIEFRLTTNVEARIKQVSYGIRPDIGSSVMNTYILASIQQTLEEEPRIQSVDGIEYKGTGDHLDIKVYYTDIDGVQQTYSGTV